MNYIGSKYSLLGFLEETICALVGADMSNMVFCDLFAGTGVVGRSFKCKVRKVISNDWEYYSYVLNRNYIRNVVELDGKDELLEELNCLENLEDGFIYKNYCGGSGSGRQYFSDENGKKIDAVRTRIEQWKTDVKISEDMYYFLLASLIESADKLANTASVYGAFLKHLKTSAKVPLTIKPAEYELSNQQNEVYSLDANELIKAIEGDILYLDPPYNARQYGANYHLLNTIAEYKPFVPRGKTGLREYSRSSYCGRKTVAASFENLIKDANFKYVILSYNNEGLMPLSVISSIMSRYGHYEMVSKDYHRFRADKKESRNHMADSTVEYLHILQKD